MYSMSIYLPRGVIASPHVSCLTIAQAIHSWVAQASNPLPRVKVIGTERGNTRSRDVFWGSKPPFPQE